jgi:hypothetical protein
LTKQGKEYAKKRKPYKKGELTEKAKELLACLIEDQKFLNYLSFIPNVTFEEVYK